MCVNSGNISDDEILAKCNREIALLEYLLENLEYDSMIVEKEFTTVEKQEDIIRTDGVERILVGSLRNSFESSNQHTDVLTEEEETVQETKVLPMENKAQKPYIFNFNKFFECAGFVVGAEGDLAKVNSQIKVKEENSMEELNPWNREVNFLERVLNSHDPIMKEGKDDREAASK